MNCRQCNVDKLSEEFPPTPLSKACKHPPYRCLRCTLEKLEQQRTAAAADSGTLTCPDCQENVSDELPIQLRSFLEFVCPAETLVAGTEPQYAEAEAMTAGGVFHVNMLDGKFCEVKYDPNMKTQHLKKQLEQQLGVPVEKQRLVFKSHPLQSFADPSRRMTSVSEYGIKPGDQLYLMQLMYAIQEGSNLKHIVMKLQWNWVGSRDYLDGSALVFNGKEHIGVIDYARKSSAGFTNGVNALTHSGDVMTRHLQLGQHEINVFLDNMPDTVTDVFFTLSAWNASTMGAFRNQAVELAEQSKPNERLGDKVIFDNVATSQALVMSRLCRSEGGWDIVSVGKTSSGNAKNYSPLINTITTCYP